jgi:hypothetical protein
VPEADGEPVGSFSDVRQVEADQLAAPERTREAEQDERSLPTPRRVGTESLDHRAQIGNRNGTHLALGGP